jgi:hypothetical protein
MKCDGQYRKCGRDAVYRVEAQNHPEVKHVCKTHVSWALSHTAYLNGSVAMVTRIRSVAA